MTTYLCLMSMFCNCYIVAVLLLFYYGLPDTAIRVILIHFCIGQNFLLYNIYNFVRRISDFLCLIYHLCFTCIFYYLSAWGCRWFVVYIRRFIYKFLHVCPLDYTAVAENGKVGPVNQVNHYRWVAVVTPTDLFLFLLFVLLMF